MQLHEDAFFTPPNQPKVYLRLEAALEYLTVIFLTWESFYEVKSPCKGFLGQVNLGRGNLYLNIHKTQMDVCESIAIIYYNE